MPTIKQRTRAVSLALLLSFIAFAMSSTALADAAADYVSKGCASSSCHGSPFGTGPAPHDLSYGKYPTNTDLADYINMSMPLGNPSACTGACATDLANYLRPPPLSPPVANASLTTPLSGIAPLSVNFNGGNSTDDKGIASYTWNFDDGSSPFTSSVPTVTHSYTVVKTYHPTLTVTDTDGLTNTASPLTITVSAVPAPPVANASKTTNTNGAAPLAVQFDGSLSTCGSVCTYAWDFGDGATGLTGASDKFSHNYTAPGTYTVTLTVTDVNTTQKSVDTFYVYVVTGETLQSYVQKCESELNFNASDVPALNCNDGVRFAGNDVPIPSLVNDFLLYKRINDTVDLAVACRWLDTHGAPSSHAASIEMLIHNRQNGSTCFFAAKDTNPDPEEQHPVSVAIVSPTNFSNIHPNANDFWMQPAQVDSRRLPTDNYGTGERPPESNFPDPDVTGPVRCIGCHVEGPYIASPDIAPYLAQFGLLNNGHDTFADMTTANHYHAVNSSSYQQPTTGSSAFRAWDSFIYGNIIEDPVTQKPVDDCSSGCHTIGRNSITGNIFTVPGGIDRLLPSLLLDIKFISESPDIMPPFESSSDYQWVNLDTPTNNIPSAGVESENFADAMNHIGNSLVPVLFTGFDPGNPDAIYNYNCPNPGAVNVPSEMEAHTVGLKGNYAFNTVEMGQISDRLRTFNLKEGLVCLNSDQDPGQQCHDFAVRYLCSVSSVDSSAATWSQWYDTDSPNYDGDHEERYRHNNICGGIAPIAIQARRFPNGGGKAVDVMGPNDRLARFSPYGLTCNNADQPDGKCSNYVVRYDSCVAPPSTYNAQLRNAWSNMLLTATGGANNADTRGQPNTPSWNTQTWIVEPVANTEYVRLKNPGASNNYLNVTNQSEGAAIVTYALNNDWDSEKWIVEPVVGSNTVRFRNVWTGKYLTLADNSNYSAVKSQGLNTGWASQRWTIQ